MRLAVRLGFGAAGLCFVAAMLAAPWPAPAIGWLLLQIFGFVGPIKFAKGDFAHPLFKGQVMLHGIALMLLVITIARAVK